MADINIEQLQAALDKLTENISGFGSGIDARTKAMNEAEDTQKKADNQLSKFGLNIQERNKQLQQEKDIQDDIEKQLKNNVAGYDKLSKAQQEELKTKKLQETATKDILKQLKDQNDSIQGLTREQNKQIEAQQRANKQKQIEAESTAHQGSKVTSAYNQMSSASGILSTAQNAATASIEGTTAKMLGVNLAFTALNSVIDFGVLSFNQWREGLDNAFQAQLAYNQQLALGADGYALANKKEQARLDLAAKQTKEQQAQYEKFGIGLAVSSAGLLALRSSSMAAAFGLGALSWPVTAVVVAVTALAAAFGIYQAVQKRTQAQEEETAAKNLEAQTELSQKLFDTFNQIGSAGMTGANGMTALNEQANKAGFALKNIDKFANILKNSQKDMSLFGAGAVEGVENFTSVAEKMTDEFGMHFRKLGINQEEQVVATEKYLALQARLGLMEGKTQSELAQGAAKYLDELDKTANLLGQTRKDQEDAREAILGIEQLQAAMMEARANGDKDREKEIGRALNQATALQKLDPVVAAGLAKIVASRGAINDESTVKASQSIPETINAVRSGTGTDFSRNQNATRELGRTYQSQAGQFSLTGVDTGMTGGFYRNLGEQQIRERETAKIAKERGIKENTPEFQALVEELSTRKVAGDKLTVDAAKQAKEQQDASILQDNNLLAGIKTFDSGADKFSKAVDKFAGNEKTSTTAGGGAVSVPSTAAPTVAKPSIGDMMPNGKRATQTDVLKWESDHAAPAAAPPHRGFKSGTAPTTAAPATIKSVNSPTVGGGRGSQGMPQIEGGENLLSFVGPSGSESSFKSLDQSLQSKVLAAAADFNSLTGSKLQINSAYRSPAEQKAMWDDSVAKGRTGRTAEGRPIGQPGSSRHENGLAVDIQNYANPGAVAALNKQGLFQTVRGDDVHFEQAKLGGVFDGTTGGYPVTLHGREAVVPLPDPSSKIKIEKPDKDELSSVVSNSSNSVSQSISSTRTDEMIAELMELMTNKMDDMISKLDQGNTYSDKLVKAMA